MRVSTTVKDDVWFNVMALELTLVDVVCVHGHVVDKLRWFIIRGEEVGVSLDVASGGSSRCSSIGEVRVGLESLGSVREDTGTLSRQKSVASPLGDKGCEDGRNHHRKSKKLDKGEHFVLIFNL
jgi:hypothetical protein